MREMSIELDESIAEKAVSTAERNGMSLSVWLSAAVLRALDLDEGLAAVREWEAENGKLTEEELAWADAVLDRAADTASS